MQNSTKCPLCQRDFKPSGWGQHAKGHVRKGELVKVEMTRPEPGDITRGYPWCSPAMYVLPDSKLAREHNRLTIVGT